MNLLRHVEFCPDRQLVLYALWLTEQRGIKLDLSEVRLSIDEYGGSVTVYDLAQWRSYRRECEEASSSNYRRRRAPIPFPDLPEPVAIIALPYAGKAAMDEWRARCAKVTVPPTKPRRASIKCRGITITKRWEWTELREREERDNIARLLKPMGWISVKMTKLPGEELRGTMAP